MELGLLLWFCSREEEVLDPCILSKIGRLRARDFASVKRQMEICNRPTKFVIRSSSTTSTDTEIVYITFLAAVSAS